MREKLKSWNIIARQESSGSLRENIENAYTPLSANTLEHGSQVEGVATPATAISPSPRTYPPSLESQSVAEQETSSTTAALEVVNPQEPQEVEYNAADAIFDEFCDFSNASSLVNDHASNNPSHANVIGGTFPSKALHTLINSSVEENVNSLLRGQAHQQRNSPTNARSSSALGRLSAMMPPIQEDGSFVVSPGGNTLFRNDSHEDRSPGFRSNTDLEIDFDSTMDLDSNFVGDLSQLRIRTLEIEIDEIEEQMGKYQGHYCELAQRRDAKKKELAMEKRKSATPSHDSAYFSMMSRQSSGAKRCASSNDEY
jgi:hypothetical protein